MLKIISVLYSAFIGIIMIIWGLISILDLKEHISIRGVYWPDDILFFLCYIIVICESIALFIAVLIILYN